MLNERCALVILALVALVASGLACGLPTPTAVTRPTVTPYVPATARPQDAPTSEPATDVPEVTEPPSPTDEVPSPTDEEAPPPPATDAPPTATDTPLPTDTSVPPPSPPPTVPPTPTATPTQPATVETLDFEPPQYVHAWEPKGSTNKVVLKVDIVGGVPPFTVSHGPTVQGTTPDRVFFIEFEWGSCKSAMVQSITVESSDGQKVKKDYYIPVDRMPWCTTPAP
jgi:hypothetical protein